MENAFGCLGNQEKLTYITPEVVLVTVGRFEDSCILFIGCQCNSVTLASNTVWISELDVCSVLATARISMKYHRKCLEFER